jgi:hypothetical protein
MLARIISAVALTLLLTGGALAYVPQPQNNIYAGHSNSVQAQESLETQLFAASTVLSEPQPHNIYAGHSNSAQAQESFQTQLFAANTAVSEPRQFD